MSDIARYLITTADERTWKFDRPVLFLGEWCRLYDRRKVWLSMDAKVANPYGLGPKQKVRDINYVQALSNELLIELKDALNTFHCTEHSTRYWNILIGHWLQRYVATVFNRYHTLKQVTENYNISGTTLFDNNTFNLSTQDSNSFVWATNDDLWNHFLYAKIFNFLDNVAVTRDTDSVIKVGQFNQSVKVTKHYYDLNIKKIFKKFVASLLQLFCRKNDALIINTYLPKWQEVKLQLAFGQCPQFWRSPILNKIPVNLEVRKSFKFAIEGSTGFEKFARSLLGDVIPICYVEGYRSLTGNLESLPWPKAPKFIFTSNNFADDEVFKAWTADKIEQDVPYYIGQHGNNYGTFLGNQNWPERTTPDKFITWGWSDSNNTVPAFIFKLAVQKRNSNPSGGLLLIEVCAPHRFTTEDNYYEFNRYLEEQFCFIQYLPPAIQEQVTVRLQSEYRFHNRKEEDLWGEFDDTVKLDKGNVPINSLIAQNRLVVHSYDSTGILETLSLNIPTLCFWQGGLEHLVPSAKPYYEMLQGADILVTSTKKAAEIVTMNWENIELWWASEKVQSARKAFCAEYAKVDGCHISHLKNILSD
jgi:putative transferase (TIGR04331 family)